MNVMSKSKSKTLILLISVIVFVAIFALNYFFPIYADDMMYSVFKYGESFDFTRAYTETFQFLDLYFFIWGGRVFAHLVAFILLMFNHIPLAIINTIGYLLLVFFSYKLVKRKDQTNVSLFVLLAVSFFYFTPSFLSSAIWTTGSANYMWMITFTVIFLYYVKVYLVLQEKKMNILQIIILAIFSLFVGCTNENLSPVIILLLILSIVYLKKENRNISKTLYLVTLMVCAGCIVLVFAPGNALRAESEGHQSLFNSVDAMGARLDSIYASYRYFMFRPLIIYVITLILFVLFPARSISIKNTFIYSLFFLFVANVSIWITLLSPSFPPRAFMSITVLTFLSIGIIYAQIDFTKRLPLVVNVLFLLCLLVFAAKDYLTFIKGSYFLDKVMKQRVEVIEKAKEDGKNEIYLEKIYLDYRFEYSDFSNYYKDYYKIKVNFVDKGDPNLQ